MAVQQEKRKCVQEESYPIVPFSCQILGKGTMTQIPLSEVVRLDLRNIFNDLQFGTKKVKIFPFGIVEKITDEALNVFSSNNREHVFICQTTKEVGCALPQLSCVGKQRAEYQDADEANRAAKSREKFYKRLTELIVYQVVQDALLTKGLGFTSLSGIKSFFSGGGYR